jgi:bifunctional non-homologous end joining protein LigD
MVFDLDPPDDDFAPVCFAARTVRAVLGDIGLASRVMTTGSRGLHVVVTLDARVDFDTVREVARRIAEVAAARAPKQLTTRQRKNQRAGRLYLDIMRNARGQTAVSPYAVRAKPGAPIATPLEWDELGDGQLRADHYHINNIFRRLGHRNDPWHDMGARAAALDACEGDLSRLEQDESA